MAEGGQRYLTEGRGKLIIMNIWKTKQDRLLLLLGVPASMIFLWLAYKLICLMLGLRGESLDTAQILTKAGVIANLLAVCVAAPGVVMVILQLRQLLARPELQVEHIVRLRPEDQATEPNYYVEISLHNVSNKIAHHFRFICYCYRSYAHFLSS